MNFYLALDRRQFAAAYRCLDPSLRGDMTLATFAAGYAITLASCLLIADERPNGQVSIDVHTIDRQGPRFLITTYRGSWQVSMANTLLHPAIRAVRSILVAHVPVTDLADVFAFDQRQIVWRVRADVTGDGQPEDLYLTMGHSGRQIWIFSQNRLIFAEAAAVGAVVTPGSDHRSFAVALSHPPSEPADEYWPWTPVGFRAVDGPGISVQPAQARVGQRVLLRGHTTTHFKMLLLSAGAVTLWPTCW